MAEVLEQIISLSDRLKPLAGKQRGMRIDAGEWNTLVDVLRGLLEIDRAQEKVVEVGLDANFARKNHQHLGEVSIDWLDAGVRPGLSEGVSPVGIRTALDDVRKAVTTLGDQVATLTTVIDHHQKELDLSAVDQLDRNRLLRGFESRFAGIEDLRTSVSAVNAQVAALSTNVNTVLDLRRTLTDPTGTPIDVAKIRTDVAALASLRDNLTGVDGTLLRMRDIEVKLKDVADAIGLAGPQGGGLGARISSVVADAETRINSRIDDHAGTLRTELTDANRASETRLRAAFASDFGNAQNTLNTAIDTKFETVETRFNARLDERLSAATTSLRTELTQLDSAQLAAGLATVRGEFRAALDATRTSISTSVTTQLTAMQTAIEQSTDQKLASVESRLNTRVDDRVVTASAGLETQLGQLVITQINDRLRDLPGRVLNAVNETIANLVPALTNDVVNRLTPVARTQVAEAVAQFGTRVGSVEGQLSDLRSQVTVMINQTVASARDQLLADLTTRFEQRLTQTQRNLENSLLTQLRTELNEAISRIRGTNLTDLDNLSRTLRSEIEASRANVINEAVRVSVERFRDLSGGGGIIR